jgi:hypothetical protein
VTRRGELTGAGQTGDRVTPPTKPGNWHVRHGTSDAAKGWEDLCQVAQSGTWEAWVVLSERPTAPLNRDRQHPLRGSLAHREVNGTRLDQWQHEVTSGGRIWYCPDPDRTTVWIVLAEPGHPKWTERKR